VNVLQRADDVPDGCGAGEHVSATSRYLAHYKALVETPVEPREGVAAVLAALAPADYDIHIAIAQPREELDDKLRGLLQVGCHHRDELPAGEAHAGADRGEGAEVARVLDDPRRQRALSETVEEALHRVVRTAIDHENRLEPSVHTVAHAFDFLQQLGNGVAVAVDGHHQRVARRAHLQAARHAITTASTSSSRRNGWIGNESWRREMRRAVSRGSSATPRPRTAAWSGQRKG